MKLKKNIAVSDTGFILDPSTGESFTVNEVGLEILNMLKEGLSFDEISSRITAEYDIDQAGLEKYYQDFIEMLNQYNLLEYK